MLVFLYLEGPYTRGVFRRSAGAKACRELRDRLDSGTEDPEISHQSVFVIAAVLKVTHSKPHTHTQSTTHSSDPFHWFETRQQKAAATDVRPKSQKSRQDNLSVHSQAGCQSHTHKVLIVQHPGQRATTAPGIQGASEVLQVHTELIHLQSLLCATFHSGHMTRDKTVLYLMIESNDRNSTDADCNNNMEVFTKQ